MELSFRIRNTFLLYRLSRLPSSFFLLFSPFSCFSFSHYIPSTLSYGHRLVKSSIRMGSKISTIFFCILFVNIFGKSLFHFFRFFERFFFVPFQPLITHNSHLHAISTLCFLCCSPCCWSCCCKYFSLSFFPFFSFFLFSFSFSFFFFSFSFFLLYMKVLFRWEVTCMAQPSNYQLDNL